MATKQLTRPSSRHLRTKDADGLTLVQRRALQALALTPDWQDACTEAKVSPSSVKHWLSTNEAFRQAYNDLLGPAVEITRDILESSAVKAAGMYDAAVEAVKMIEIEVACPECHHEFSVTNPYPDWATRLRAGDTLLRVSRLLKDVKEIEGSITHLNMEEMLALSKLKHAIKNRIPHDIPPSMMARIQPYLPAGTVQEDKTHEDATAPVVDDR